MCLEGEASALDLLAVSARFELLVVWLVFSGDKQVSHSEINKSCIMKLE